MKLNLLFIALFAIMVMPMSSYADTDLDVPTFPDEVYRQRLQNISTEIDYTYNELVRNHIHGYVVNRRDHTQKILGRSFVYFSTFEKVLKKYDLPSDLKYIPIIESALNPKAVSKSGATGLWQFMYPTGKEYGLSVTSSVDERKDPYLSSEAAAKYLSRLYKKYGDWMLVIAAYNCGPGRVDSAISKAKSKNFWNLYDYLPRETRGYVPAFISAAYTMNYYHAHKLQPIFPDHEIHLTEAIRVHRYTTFKEISELTGLPITTIQKLNPSFKLNSIPSTNKGYLLTLPVNRVAAFLNSRTDTYVHHNSSPAYNAKTPVAAPRRVVHNSSYQDYINYTVQRGDYLSKIARIYECSVAELQEWNGLNGTLLRVNQKLKVYVNPPAYSTQASYKLSPATKSPAIYAPAVSRQSSTGGFVYYKIQKGDTLWSIATRYPGISANDLKVANNISDPTRIQPGQEIKINLSI